jgi:hypothetical protein
MAAAQVDLVPLQKIKHCLLFRMSVFLNETLKQGGFFVEALIPI